MGESALCKLKKMGQSVWLDFISRDLLQSGQFEKLVEDDCVCGVTVNPTIFEQAMVGSDLYDDHIISMLNKGSEIQEIYHKIMIADVVNASMTLHGLFDDTSQKDGYVSVEVAPKYAHDVRSTIKEAKELMLEASQPNIMIKVPGTEESAKAIRELTAAGLNINVTLLFSPDQYIKVAEAYMAGLEDRLAKNYSISMVQSVASLFVSRIDTMVDNMLDEKTKDDAKGQKLKGKTAVAVAKKTYQSYISVLTSERWKKLSAKGANPQRLLWASTSTKNPVYSNVKYVEELMAPDTINTMTLDTIEAFRDYPVTKETISADLEKVDQWLASLKQFDINLADVFSQLQKEGIKKFDDSYKHLFAVLEEKCDKIRAA